MSQVGPTFGQVGDGPIPANFEIVAACMDVVNEALARVSFQAGDSPFVIVDYGTANGLVSMGLMKHCIEWVKSQYGDDQAVCIIYEDQLGNDFNKLFENILGKSSFVHDYKNISIMASATGFYSPCVPRQYVHFGYSSSSMHNLSRKPCILKNTLLYLLSDDAEEREAFQKQAAEDWERILLCRAEELVPGGQLVVSIPGDVGDAYPLYQPATHKKCLLERLSHFWRLMRNKGAITEEEYQKASFACYFGNEAFFKAPILEAESMVSRSGMRLVRIETATTKSPSPELWVARETEEKTTANEKYGEQFSRLIRQFSQGVFRKALSDERPEKEKEAVLYDVYATLAKDVALYPSEYTTASPHYILHFEKEEKRVQNNA